MNDLIACKRSERIVNLRFRKIGKWRVLAYAGKTYDYDPAEYARAKKRGTVSHFWRVRCDCGAERLVMHSNLMRGGSRSCGSCRYRGKRGLSSHPLYPVWCNMRHRCHNRKHTHYRYYGARGINVCFRWRTSFESFIADLPPKPKGPARYWSLDRIDNDGNYEPGNVRWATPKQQARNKRRKGSV